MSKQVFIETIGTQAQRIYTKDSLLASVITAQACLESNYGKSGLAKKAHNLFGVKGSYQGASVTMLTTEYKGNERFKTKAKFAKYPNWYDSLLDLVDLYKHGDSWNHDLYKNLFGVKDFKEACRLLEKDGYATDPNYADKLIKVIQENNLTRFDKTLQAGEKKRTSGKAIVKWPGIDYSYPATRYGTHKADVKRIQRALNICGLFKPIKVDGRYGPKTESEVKAYQRNHGLTVDGVVGVNTWNMLF